MGQMLDFAEVLCHRHLDCGLYSACLDLVTSRKWISFTCRDCDLFPGADEGACRGPATVLHMPLLAEN